MGLCNNRIVVKVGTSTLTNDAGKSDLRAIDRLVCTLADIQNMGYEVILVSSGAIAVGRNKLNMHEKPDSMRMKQAAAAVGQCSLMSEIMIKQSLRSFSMQKISSRKKRKKT